MLTLKIDKFEHYAGRFIGIASGIVIAAGALVGGIAWVLFL